MALSISFARSSGDWPFLAGRDWSIFWNSPSGVSAEGSFDCLSQFSASSWSFNLSSGVRLEIGTGPSFSNGAALVPLASGTLLLCLIQSKAFSISRALSFGDCPFFSGRDSSINFNSSTSTSAPSKSTSLGLPERIQLKISSTSFKRSSGDFLLLGGTDPTLSNGATDLSNSSGFIPTFLQ